MSQITSSHLINQKIYWISSFVLFIFLLLALRLFFLQCIYGDHYYLLSQRNYTRTAVIESPRGNILDCKNRILATNKPITSLYWNGTGNRTLSSEQQQLLTVLESLLETSWTPEHLKTIQTIERKRKCSKIASDLRLDQLGKILEITAHNPNISISTDFKRFYPHGTLASHLIGHIHHINMETMGKMGLEKMVETTLKGHKGKLLKIINSVGSNVCQYELYKALAGNNCKTTIDLDIQKIAQEVFPEFERGTIIIMDPKTGALKALVSKPDFDPELFLNPISPEQWHSIQEGNPFINRAFNACYPPASPFKLITMSAALEHGIVTPETTTYCRGFLRFKGRSYHCSKRAGHGPLTALEAVAHSCNIIFFEIAKRLSIDVLHDYATRFGLGQKTNILFPEQLGIIPNTMWKIQSKGERWWPGETLSAAIGQSYLLTTPIQVVCMIASIFEGFLVTPRVLEQEPIIKKPLRLLPSTRDFLMQGMKEATTYGTAYKVGYIKNINVSAKTGTGQTSALNKRELGKDYLEHASFVAYFNYKEQEPLVMLILIEHAGSSRVATQTAREFLLKYRTLCEQEETAVRAPQSSE